jgi:hypothetical protein
MTRTFRTRTATAVLTVATGLALVAASGVPAQAVPVAQQTRTSASSLTTGVSATTFADRMVRAWGRGDHSATRYYTTRPVTNTLFGQADPGGSYWRRTGAEGAAGTIYVTYRDDARGGTLTVGVSNIALHDGHPAHSIRSARFRNEPRQLDAVQWADHLVRAWGRGDHWTASYYATPDVLARMFAHANPGGPHWDRVGEQGAAGTIYVAYRNSATGERMTLGVSDVILGQGGAHAAYQLRF